MDSSSCRGQVLAEVIWAMLLVVGFTVFITKLYQAAAHAHHSPRWEIQKDKYR